MAYVTAYEVKFKDRYAVTWNAYISLPGYSGASVYLTAQGDPIFINYEVLEHYTHSPIKASFCELNLIEYVDDTFKDLFLYDRAAKIQIYRNSVLYWQGWSIAEGYYSLYNLCPKPVKITFVDGLTLLKTIPLPVDTMGGPDKYLIKQYFKTAFDTIGLNNKCYEAFNITSIGLGLFERFYIDSWRWYNPDETYVNMYEVLSDILTAFGARLYQHNGHWKIDNITDLIKGTITYNRYSSAFALEGTTEESKFIEGLTPINHSVYKELDRPYSKLNLKADYGLNQNCIRYPKVFSADCKFSMSEDNILRLTSDIVDPYLQGIKYYLGFFTIQFLNQIPFTVSLKGFARGTFKVKLIIENTLDGKTYTYNNEDNTFWDEKKWVEADQYAVLFKKTYSATTLEVINETIDVYKNILLKGNMYLIICPPYELGIISDPDWNKSDHIRAKIDMNQTTVYYNECKKQDHTFNIENSTLNSNEKNISVKLYSNPSLTYRYGLNPGAATWNTLSSYLVAYVNPGAVYPGIIYTDKEEDMIYEPIQWLLVGNILDGGGLYLIEEYLMNQIMSFYAKLRIKASGTIIGDISFGQVIKYDGKIFMIIHMNKNIKKQTIDITLLELSQYGSFLVDENDDYILTEDGNKIIL